MTLAEAKALLIHKQHQQTPHQQTPLQQTQRQQTSSAITSTESAFMQLQIELHDPVLDRERLEQLAYACDPLSPRIGLEESDQPACLYLDLTGLSRLFGSEQRLVNRIVHVFRNWGYVVKAAVAETIGKAWGAAHFAKLPWRRIDEEDSSPLPCDETDESELDGSASSDDGKNNPQANTHQANPEQASTSLAFHQWYVKQQSANDAAENDTVEDVDHNQSKNLIANRAKAEANSKKQGATAKSNADERFAELPLPWDERTEVAAPVQGWFEPLRWDDDIEQQSESWPVEALRLPPSTSDLLRQLGIVKLGQLAFYPRESLVTRLGPIIVTRLDQWLGERTESIQVWRQPAPYRAETPLEYPTAHLKTIQEIVRRQVHEICRQLQKQQQGVLRLEVRLAIETDLPEPSDLEIEECEFRSDAQAGSASTADATSKPQGRSNGSLRKLASLASEKASRRKVQQDSTFREKLSLRVGVFEPTAGPEHLMSLLKMQLERLKRLRPIREVQTEVVLSAPCEAQQCELFDHGRQLRKRELASLVNRLSCRLGRQQVLKVEWQQAAQPELAYSYLPLAGRPWQPRKSQKKAAPKRRRVKLRGDADEPNASEPNATGSTRSLSLDSGTRPGDPVEDGQAYWVGRATGSSRQHGSDRAWQASLFRQVDRDDREHELPLSRPLQLFAQPVAIDAVAVAGGGMPASLTWQQQTYRVVEHWGPERIETGWWRSQSACRDYYRVETEHGQRWWIFHDRRQQKWFLHGVFG